MSLDQVTNSSAELLQNKTFGGVSRESALAAIKNAAEKVDRASKEIICKLQQELEAYKGKTAQEMAELTSQKDSISIQLRESEESLEKTTESLEKATKSLEKATEVKVYTKTLPNGNKETRKVNKNGAVMVKEFTPDGKLIKCSVTQLDGSIRRTTYDPVTGKPIKTFTNIGGDRLIEYKDNGDVKQAKAVNKKRVKAEKPTIVYQTSPKSYNTGFSSERATSFERHYSDGSKETVIYCYNNDESVRYIKTQKQHEDYFEEKIVVPESHEKITKNYKDGKRIYMEKTYDGRYKDYFEDKEDTLHKRYASIRITEQDGKIFKQKAILDENGVYTGKYERIVKDVATGKILEEKTIEIEK